MELIVMLKPTAIIRFGIPEGESFKNFVNGVFRLKAWAPGRSKACPLKRQVIVKNRQGGVFNMATVGRGPSLIWGGFKFRANGMHH